MDLLISLVSNATLIALALYVMRSWINLKFKDSEIKTSELIKEKYRQSAKYYDDRYELIKKMFSLSAFCQNSIVIMIGEFSLINEDPSYNSEKWASESLKLGEMITDSYSWDSMLHLLLDMDICLTFVELRQKYINGNMRFAEATKSDEKVPIILNILKEWQTTTINQEDKLRLLCRKDLGLE
jgi:hypothetical protein